jgi:hypothetical protein
MKLLRRSIEEEVGRRIPLKKLLVVSIGPCLDPFHGDPVFGEEGVGVAVAVEDLRDLTLSRELWRHHVRHFFWVDDGFQEERISLLK